MQEAYIDRMEDELKELDEKLLKLDTFTKEKEGVFSKLPGSDRQLLYIQMSTMSTYGATLSMRISIAKAKAEDK